MTLLDLIDYFEDIATRLRDISHTSDTRRFCRANIAEILNGLQGIYDLSRPVLILENYGGRLSDQRSDDIRNVRSGAFLIIQKVEADNFEEENQVRSKTEQILFKVLAQLRKDYRERHELIKHIDLNSIRYDPVSNLVDGACGWRCEFSLNNPVNKELKFNEADWY